MKTNELIAILRNEDDPNVLDYIQEAADTLQLQKVRIMELETELKRVKAKQRWIPVTERLPEDLCPVLVSLKGLKKAFVGRYQDSEWWSEGASSRPFMLEVTHWMPQPSPPKEV